MLPLSVKDALRFNGLYPLHYAFDLLCMRTARRKPCRILLVSDNRVYTSQQQFAPLMLHRSYLRQNLGVVLNHKLLNDVLAAPQILSGYDVTIAKLGFHTPEATAVNILKTLRNNSGRTKLIYFDGDDDLCIQWKDALELVDLYVKKQIFADSTAYLRRSIGKSNLTDYVARTHGWSFADNIIPASGPVDSRYLHKIVLAHNIASDETIVHLFQNVSFRAEEVKDIDIFCRAGFAADDWIQFFRRPVLEVLTTLKDRYRMALFDKRVRQKQYYAEMRRSRICVSPFGYGEICWRDFEAIICRCLLVKPDMSHLRTEPNVFLPGETYIPVRWDFSDLAEVCQRYLSDEAETRRITQRAYEILADYYINLGSIDRFRQLLVLIGLMKDGVPTAAGASGALKSHGV